MRDRPANGQAREGSAWLQLLTTIAAAVAGLVAFVLVLGGIVMWLRFRKAELPADQAVALMTREQMLSIGLRLMVLPTIISGALAMALAGMAPTLRASRRFRVALATAGILAVALLVVLPATWATLTWVSLLLVIVYAWRGFGLRRPAPNWTPPPWRLAAVAVLAAALISLGRQIDEPVQLLQADATIDAGGHREHVHGLFVSADATAVYVGDETTRSIRALRRADVAALQLGPPIEHAPNRSLLSLVLFADRWSLTPLRWWCNGESYPLSEVSKLCRTQPSMRESNERRGLDMWWIPVRVSCPAASDGPCRGYLRLRTHETYSRALGPFAASRRVAFPAATTPGREFSIPANRTRELCVRVTNSERRLLRRPDNGRRATEPVPLDVVLSSDPRGASVMSADTMRLDVPRANDPSEMSATECGAQYRRALVHKPARREVARAVGALDGHQIEVRGPHGLAVVRLAGLDGPATPSYVPTSACGEAEGKDVLLRRLFARPRDLNGDELADHPGGRALALVLLPDPDQGDRDPQTSYLLRHVRPAGSHRTLDESVLASGWVIRNHRPVGPPKFARALARATRKGRRTQSNLFTRCRGDHWDRRAAAGP